MSRPLSGDRDRLPVAIGGEDDAALGGAGRFDQHQRGERPDVRGGDVEAAGEKAGRGPLDRAGDAVLADLEVHLGERQAAAVRQLGARRPGKRVTGEVAGERQRPVPAAALGRRALDPHRCAGDRLVEDPALGDEHGGVDVGPGERAGDLRVELGRAVRLRREQREIGDAAVDRAVDRLALEREVAGRGQAGAAHGQVGDRDPPAGPGAHLRRQRRLARQEPRQHRLAEVEAAGAAVEAQRHAVAGEGNGAGGGQRQAAAGRLGLDRRLRARALAARGDGERRQADRTGRIDGEIRPRRGPGELRCVGRAGDGGVAGDRPAGGEAGNELVDEAARDRRRSRCGGRGSATPRPRPTPARRRPRGSRRRGAPRRWRRSRRSARPDRPETRRRCRTGCRCRPTVAPASPDRLPVPVRVSSGPAAEAVKRVAPSDDLGGDRRGVDRERADAHRAEVGPAADRRRAEQVADLRLALDMAGRHRIDARCRARRR